MHRYPPAVWGDEDEDDEDVEWDDEGYEDEDPELAEEQEQERERALAEGAAPLGMEPDDGMSWEDGAVEGMQSRPQQPTQIVVASSSSEMSFEEQQNAARRQQQQQQVLSQQRVQDDRQRTITPNGQGGQTGQLRTQTSRERLAGTPDGAASGSPTSPSKIMDPAQVTETRKVSITPAVARSADDHSPQREGPLLPSAIMQQQSEERKRTREEIEALEDAQRKKANKGPSRPVSSASDQKPSPGKLRKERDRGEVTTDDDSKDKKKKAGGVFGGLFGRKKDKGKDKGTGSIVSENGSIHSSGSFDNLTGRNSAESGRSSSQQHEQSSPVTANARQQQQQAIQQQKNSTDPRRSQLISEKPQATATATATTSPIHAQLSQHATQLRQRDQQQQALYQQYLNRSPSSPPEAQPSYGLQSVSAIMSTSSSFASSQSSSSGLMTGSRPRPGSIVLSPSGVDAGLPDLSVIRIFAGNNLRTEATFKTVLLNSSTTASDLVRQAIQRFRLSNEGLDNYYLSIKQVEGSSAVLRPHEKPLVVFESLVEAAMELPKVKRSSVGSISSVASNLSMHPAIKKLSMNDFTDDSAVKFYLNMSGPERDGDLNGDEGDETMLAESIYDEDTGSPRSGNQYLTINTGAAAVTPERFSSPSYRFALQLAIHPEDLPDDLVFDPLTEAIVFKHTLRDRQTQAAPSPGISTTQRRKVFVFPKNVTVAEVIELGLERFGIIEGVVDGGDEVEDKMTKRRSSSRVRYCLAVEIGGRGKCSVASQDIR